MVFNELSAQPASDKYAARKRMSTFIGTTVVATGRFGVKQVLRIEKNFFSILLAPDYPLNKWLNDSKVNLPERSRFKRLLCKYPPLAGFEDTEIEDRHILSEFSYNGSPASGLGTAYLLGALALSLDSDVQWSRSRLPLRTPETVTVVPHASHPDHVSENADWIKEQLKKEDPWLKNGLPKNGEYRYRPPKSYYSEKSEDFPTAPYTDRRRGFTDRNNRLWLWHEEEKHWDVQIKPYGRGKYFRVTPEGRRLRDD